MSGNGEASPHARPVFISHSSRDKELVGALVDMLKLGVGLRDENYFCSDLPVAAVRPGEDILNRIRTELSGTALAIEIITPSYLESRFCNWELGGLWVAMRQNFPLLVPPASRDDLDGVLRNIQVPYIEEGLDDLAQDVAEAIHRNIVIAAWNNAKSQFLERWSSALRRQLQGRGLVPLEEYNRVVDKLEAASVGLRAFEEVGKKYDYFLESFPELIRGVHGVICASDENRQMAVSDLEYVVAYRAAHLHNRHDLRSVVWHLRNSRISPGKWVGHWAEGQPGLDAHRERQLIEGPIQHNMHVCVKDQASTDHAEQAMLGPGDEGYPSFLLASMLAGGRNYGLLQLEASNTPPLDREDLEVASLMAAMLACGLSVAPAASGADSIAGPPGEGGD